jgi:polar amino acid transport system substrate-binding protein
MVRSDSLITRNADVDVSGKQVVVGKGSAYDLFLTRHLKHATIIRAVSSQAVIPDFLAQHIEIAAGVKQQLDADTKDVTGLRMLPERFMVINQAMGVPKTKGTAAAVYLRHFVEEMKANGFVQDSMTRHGIQGAGVGYAANPDKDPLEETS